MVRLVSVMPIQESSLQNLGEMLDGEDAHDREGRARGYRILPTYAV